MRVPSQAQRAGRRVAWQAPSTPVHVVYPSIRHLSTKVRTFVDPVQARMTPPPWELDVAR